MNNRCYELPLSILVVDDDPILLRLLESMLRSDRHTVGLASDSEEALELFNSREWDIVLTDLRMPGLGGSELAAELRKIAPQQPIIIMTGYAGYSAFENDELVIHKPFKRNSISTIINRALRPVTEGEFLPGDASRAA